MLAACIYAVTVPEQVLWRSVVGKCLQELLLCPLSGWMVGHIEMHNSPLSWDRMRNTYKIRKLTIDRTKKSPDTICLTWFSKNVRLDCDGGLLGFTMYLTTVA
jgi:hypothetical protein